MSAHLDVYNISPLRRELYFRVINDEPDIHPIATRLHYLHDHFPAHLLDAALKWLISNNFVGKRFVLWHSNICKGSDLEMVRQLVAIAQNQNLAPLIAGRNFIL